MAASFITSEKNKRKLCDAENHIYEKHADNCRKTKTYWRCERFYKGCKARVHTTYNFSDEPPKIIFSTGTHNHFSVSSAQFKARKAVSSMKSEAKRTGRVSTREIIASVVQKLDDVEAKLQLQGALPGLSRNIRNWRQRQRAPRIPAFRDSQSGKKSMTTSVLLTPTQMQQHLQAVAPPLVPAQPAPRQVQVLTAPRQVQVLTAPRQVLTAPVQVTKQKPVERPRPKEKRIFVVADHQRCVMSNLTSLWKNGKLCDAGIGNGSSTVMVHKLVLSAVCPKLLSVFNMDMLSHEFLQVNFPKEVSSEALNAFAEYMYNGILDLDPDILTQLKVIAKRLDMKDFEQLCDSHLPNNIHQSASASFTNVPSFQTNMQIPGTTPFGFDISTSVLSDPEIIDIKDEISDAELVQIKKEPVAIFSQESTVVSPATNRFGNADSVVISPNIKTEPVGPEDHKYAHKISSSSNQALSSTTPAPSSSSITAATTASSSISLVPVSSTEFAIPFSESADVKSTRLKTSHPYGAPLISDLSHVSNTVETMHSQSSSMHENSSKPSDSLPKSYNDVYPIRLFSVRGDNLPLLTTDSPDVMTVD